MNNLFKKLAFMMALTMTVATAAPAAQASAAATPVLNTTSKKLYMETDVATGKYGNTFTLKVWNLGDYRVTFESSNPEVATVNKWWGTVKTVAPGEATITATISNKTTGKVVKTLTSKVWVKRNATDIGFSTASAAKLDEALKVGDKAKLNVFRTDADGNVSWKQADKTKVTDYIQWTSSDTSVATVDKWGTVTAVAPGEATITATSLQTEDKTVPTTEVETIKVTVAEQGLVSATQKDLDTANLTFGTEMTSEKVNKDTVKVYSLVGNTKVAQTVKSVTIDSEDATKATVDLFVDFAKNTTYVVEYGDTSVEFVAVDPSAENVKSVVINTTEAVAGTATELKYSLLTENGVDITEAIDGRVDFTTESNDCYIDTTSKKITFFEKGKVAEVKATFHTYKYTEAGVEETLTTSAAIKSVEAASYELGTVKAWTFATDDAFDFEKDTVNQKISLSESATGRYLIAKFVKNDADKTVVLSNSDSKFTFESSNTNVLIVAGNQVFPVTTGTATVIVKYDGKAIDTINVTVLPKRESASLTVSLDKSSLSLAKDWDVTTVKFEVKDQLGDEFNNNKVKIQLLSAPEGATKFKYFKDSATEVTGGKITLTGDDFDKEGIYQYKVTAGDITKVFSIRINKPGTTSTQKLEVSSKEVDTTLKVTTDNSINGNKDVEIKLYSVDTSNVKTDVISGTALHYGKAAAVAAVGTTPEATAYYYEVIDTEGKVMESTDVALDTTNHKFMPVAVSGGSIVKAKAGTYRVAAYKVTNGKDAKQTVIGLGVDYITVKDSQVAATVEQKKVNSTASTIEGALANGDIVIKLDTNNDGKAEEIQNAVNVKEFVGVNAAGNTVYLKTVTYDAKVNYAGVEYTYTMTIDVNKNITLAK